ncbi:MAG: hypothetical protein ACTSR3_06450 [Candidatus Helarchaeota archaeon]
MIDDEIKKLKLKKKEVLHNIEILDKKMKKGKIGATDYFQQFDEQKELLRKIKLKIQELEDLKRQGGEKIKHVEPEFTPEEEVFGISELEKKGADKEDLEDDTKELSLSDKIKAHLPNLPNLKLKIGGLSSKKDSSRNIEKGNLRNFKFFHENRLTLNDHPNFIHLAIRDFMEELGYKILKIKKPLPEMIEIEQGKSKIIEISGYLVGVKLLNSSDSQDTLSIFIKQEGICTIFFDGQGVVTNTKAQISLAGKSNPDYDNELEKDILKINEKIKTIS